MDDEALTASVAVPVSVLFVCTGNQCRSPMAEAFLRAELLRRGSSHTVASAGFVSEGVSPPQDVIDVMSEYGLDLSRHKSRRVTEEMIESSDLIVGMTRQHVVDLIVLSPSAWRRCFTFSDLVSRTERIGARHRGEAVAAWVGRLDVGRSRSALLALKVADDVADPMGGRRSGYVKARDLLSRMSAGLAAGLSPA